MPDERWKGIEHRIRRPTETGSVEIIGSAAEGEENEGGSRGARGSRTGPGL